MPDEVKRLTPDMGEISGFGGSYEAGCVAMVEAGIAWVDAHPDAEPKFHGFEGVYGLIMEDNDDAKALTKAMMDATIELDGRTVRVGTEATGAMHHACTGHVMAYRALGWEAYCRKRREPEPASES